MRVPLEWLREMIDVQETPEELAELLTGVGLEVDAIERVAPGAGGVVAGRVLAVEPHPDAGSLWVCRVDAGPRAGTVTIVTGAPNVRAGMAVAVALPGAVLPGGMRVEARDLRGVTSTGMICSLHEMGLGDQPADREGIADLEEVLPGRVPAPGADLAGLLGWGEPVLVLSLTPNLAAHCQSILGVARELAAVTGRPLRGPAAGAVRPGRPGEAPGQGGAEPGRAVPGQAGEEPGRAVPGAAGHGTGEDLAASGGEAAARVRVVIEDPDGCALYVARVLEDVRPGGSPLWLRRRLVAVGMRPIDRIVDVTNYVMLELGQPLHAFDLEAVREGTIVVRPAREGERLVTLDGRERRLAAGDLVIADPERAIGLAGVMGGENSEVSASTRAVLLEAAWFDPRRVRVTARRHGLRTEAALRFEKGVDPAGVRAAAGRAMELLAAIGAGRPVPGRAEAVAREFPPRRLPWRPARIRQWLGAEL
ncbi:MAG TPA: phenylalanine--tRNA ligase subunit beta, partial [Thermaerobacter sp.]